MWGTQIAVVLLWYVVCTCNVVYVYTLQGIEGWCKKEGDKIGMDGCMLP